MRRLLSLPFLLLGFTIYLTSNCHGASWFNIGHVVDESKNSNDSNKRSVQGLTMESLINAMGLRDNEKLVETNVAKSVNKTTVQKLGQKVCEIKVYGSQVTVRLDEETGLIQKAHGSVLTGTDFSCSSLKTLPESNARDVVQDELNRHYLHMKGLPGGKLDISCHLFIEGLEDSDGKTEAEPTYHCYSTVFRENEIIGVTYKVKAGTGEVFDTFEENQTYLVSGIKGGNEKTWWTFSTFDVTRQSMWSSSCQLTNPNIRIYSNLFLYTFTCSNPFKDNINEAFSPLADMWVFSRLIFEMYEELTGSPMIVGTPYPVPICVHYGTNYVNAFYAKSTGALYFGDGDVAYNFYPFTMPDVIAHELAHRVTFEQSGLEYRYMSGGLNEAFSDLCGIMADYRIFRQYDWEIGDRIVTSGHSKGHLRDMCNQHHDGSSISHASDYYSSIDPHYSSGVFNLFFCNVANYLDLSDIFKIFARANKLHWGPTTTFDQAACGVMESAEELGYSSTDLEHIQTEFAYVGVNCPSFTIQY